MAVFRVEKSKNYTVMSNHHLRDKELSLKAIGLLSKMLSLPEEWDYTTRGLAAICKDGVDAIGAALKELEACGYLVRHRLRDDRGRMRDTEYVIYESPHTALPDTEKPYVDNPDTEKPDTGNPAQLSKDRTNTQKQNTVSQNPYQSNLSGKYAGWDGIGCDDAEKYREIVLENIEYDILIQDPKANRDRLDEIVDLMVETLCSTRPTINVAGNDYPASMVKDRLLKLGGMHIDYVFECLDKNTTYVRNIKKYLLATLFNAPSTMDSYYSAMVNHDMYGDGSRGK